MSFLKYYILPILFYWDFQKSWESEWKKWSLNSKFRVKDKTNEAYNL